MAFDLERVKSMCAGGDARQSLFFLARTAERAERYNDMAQVMGELVRQFGAQGLTREERDTLTIAFKKLIGPYRAARDSLEPDKTEPRDPKFEPVVTDYKQQLEVCILARCQEALEIFEDILVKKNDDSQAAAKVYYLCSTADYYRYMADIDISGAAHSSQGYYKKALALAEKALEPTDPVRLNTVLNYSVFLKELAQDIKQACGLAKNAFDEAISKLDDLDEAAYKDTTLIMQLLRDNLTLWTSGDKRSSSS
jgi:14-3-3 protein epsilon